MQVKTSILRLCICCMYLPHLLFFRKRLLFTRNASRDVSRFVMFMFMLITFLAAGRVKGAAEQSEALQSAVAAGSRHDFI